MQGQENENKRDRTCFGSCSTRTWCRITEKRVTGPLTVTEPSMIAGWTVTWVWPSGKPVGRSIDERRRIRSYKGSSHIEITSRNKTRIIHESNVGNNIGALSVFFLPHFFLSSQRENDIEINITSSSRDSSLSLSRRSREDAKLDRSHRSHAHYAFNHFKLHHRNRGDSKD